MKVDLIENEIISIIESRTKNIYVELQHSVSQHK